MLAFGNDLLPTISDLRLLQQQDVSLEKLKQNERFIEEAGVLYFLKPLIVNKAVYKRLPVILKTMNMPLWKPSTIAKLVVITESVECCTESLITYGFVIYQPKSKNTSMLHLGFPLYTTYIEFLFAMGRPNFNIYIYIG